MEQFGINRRKRKGDEEVVLDIWRVLGFNDHPVVDREPVWRAQQLVGHRCQPSGLERDDEFLHWSLTTNITNPLEYLSCAEQRFGCARTNRCDEEFEDLLNAEKEGTELYPDVIPSLARLKDAGVDMSVLSNLWHFPAERIMDDLGVGNYIEPAKRVFSYEIGFRKPDMRAFYEVCRRSGKRPEQCIMVDDNLEVIRAAAQFGMRTVFMDREGRYTPATVMDISNCTYANGLDTVLDLLGIE